MSEYCCCGHYRFDHIRSERNCDKCFCERYEPACAVCKGSGRLQVANVTTVVDWTDPTVIDCPHCHE